MAELSVCTRCGLTLPESGEGLCLHCLLKAGLSEPGLTEPAGKRPAALREFGPYRAIGVLGEGGMGIVYLAEESEPIRRRVALKVLKHGGRPSTARFKSEIQALALMDHPNIAKIYHAGADANGHQYLAMEYVPGIPITDFCDRELLGCDERLMLFEHVCRAVHHAHQKGIIHRDLKPSNVLVTLQDGQPVPKIIDFGVAKALDHRLAGDTLFTERGVLIGTPEYMSPEQADPTELDVDSATDVYSLGVLLYELLVGALPFDPRVLRRAGYAEIQRIIREDEPPKPSVRLSSMGNTAQEVARRRRNDVRGLLRLLRGDLEWITMKALEKDRKRRYASASEFASDIARHVANEPVMARPPEMGYRLRKFGRRHRVVVAGASTVTLALIMGAIVSFLLYLRASREQERAESESYSANMSAAEMQLRIGQNGDAKARLASTPRAFRGWEWRYLMARTDESSATIYSPEFKGPVNRNRSHEMRFSEDGAQIFDYGATFLRSWDLATKRLVTDLSGLGRILAIGAHSKTVLVGPQLDLFADPPAEGFVLRLYDVGTRRILATLRGLTSNIRECAISEDGTLVAAGRSHKDRHEIDPDTVMIWDARTGAVVARLKGHRDYVSSVRFSPDGKLLASASLDKTVRLWDLATPGKSLTLQHGEPVDAISLSRDGRLLASGGSDGMVRIWNSATGVPIRSWRATPFDYFDTIAFSPDASLLATTSGQMLRVWNVETGQLVRDLNGVPGTTDAIAFHPTAHRLYTEAYGIIKEWDLDRHGPLMQDTNAGVMTVAVSVDGKYIGSGSSDGMVRIYDAASRKLLQSWTAHSGEVKTVAFSPDSLLIASGSTDKTIKLWNVPDGSLARQLTSHTSPVLSVAFSPDDKRLISGGADRTIRVWDTGSNTPRAVISTSDISEVAWSRDGSAILALRRSDKALLLWDAETRQNHATLSSDTTENTPFLRRSALAVSRDGTVALGPADTGTAIAVWDLRKRRLQRILPIFHRPVWYTADETISALALSPDGSRVAIGGQSSGQIAIWDLRRGKLVLTFSGHTQVVHSLAWMPDGIALVSSSLDGTVRIWDSGSDHNYDAELLLETLSARCMLVEEVVQELEADRSITPELRNETIQLAKRHGNAFPNMLFIEAWRTGAAPSRPIQEYRKALRRAMVAARLMPWYGRGWTTLAVLQYRTGDSDEALVSSNRAMEMQKSQARDAHAIRAMAFCRLHDSARAQTELDLGRRARGMFQGVADSSLLEEAQSLISAQKAALASIR